MLNLFVSSMAGTTADEVFEITDKNFQKISENVEKVNFINLTKYFVIVLFNGDVTL